MEWMIGVRISPAAKAVMSSTNLPHKFWGQASYSLGTGALSPGAKLTRA